MRHWYLHILEKHLTQRRKETKFRQEFKHEIQQKASVFKDKDIEIEKSKCRAL